MKANIEVEFKIDGPAPSESMLQEAFLRLFSGYLPSEGVDGTDDWGLEIGNIEVSIQSNKESIHE